MNERMTELYRQAARYAFNQRVIDQSFANDLHSLINEKFAELIVRECARISNEVDYTMTNQGAASAQAFMEHFGVEE